MFIPHGKRVLVRRNEADETTSSGIIINVSKQEKPSQGIIISVSNKSRNDGFLPGHEIMFGKYSGVAVVIDDEDLVIVDTDDILGTLKEEDDNV